jgi:glycosyltransferase involved in cell wall biosynthesis
MHIAIDGRELAGRPTGVGRYLRGLLDAWSRDDRARQHSWVVCAHEAVSTPIGEPRLLPGRGGTFWEQVTFTGAVRREGADVLFAPGYTAPLKAAVPVALTIHDVSYFAHPEWFRPREGLRRRMLTARSVAAARVVLTDSEFSKREIVAHLGVSAERIRVIYPGLARRSPATRLNRRSDPLVLFAGSIFNRRRVPDLIRGFSRVSRQHPDARLEIVGDDRTYPPQDLAALVAKEKLDGRVTLRAYVDEAQLADLYARARVFAFLSEYEGFGLTPLEAMRAGVPPMVLDTPVAREVCGEAALYVPSSGPDDVAAGLSRLLSDEHERARLIEASAAVLQRYQWDVAAARTLDALEEAAGK